ncbi:MAG: ROK family transcriptional regulator [Chlorobi bacterium]|nr:ROK family transcriptional regulator [Chlorobiota bacterium]
MKTLFKHKVSRSHGVELKRISQKMNILKAIFFNGPLSNAELAKEIALSTPMINNLLVELIEDDLIIDLGTGDSSGGRPPNIYGLVDDGFYVVGISIGVHSTGIAIFNSNNKEVVPAKYFPVKIQSNISIFSKINSLLEEIIKESGIDRNKIVVVGIEMPGLVDYKNGVNRTYFPGYNNLYDELNKIFKFPVYFENDAKVSTFAEQHFGLAKGRQNVLVVQTGWGVGLGLILNGQLYSGKTGYAGEFGHLPIVENGILCKCGKKGCLETIASATAIARIAKEGILSGNPSLINELVDNNIEKVDTSIVIRAAHTGDQFAISVLAEVGHWLGRGIAFLIQIFNPELIIINGNAAQAFQFMMAPIQQAIHTYSNHDISNDTEIKISKLGSKAGIQGAAALALEKITEI